MAGNELEVRRAAAGELVEVFVPKPLAALGIQMGEVDGMRMVAIPDDVRAKVNLVTPVMSLQQADPNFTPSVRMVQLDPGTVLTEDYGKSPDFYSITKGSYGLTKHALNAIAQAAGVVRTQTRLIPKDELRPGCAYGYRATVTIRRSDGSMETVEADRDWHEDARRSEIEAETKKAATKYNWSAEKFETEFAKRWNFELQYGAGSIQTKALNRALRAAINLPTSVTREQVTKPWLVVGYQLTPDYSDPEVKRIVISAGLSASGDLYGGVPPQIAAPEPPPSGGPQPNTEPQEPPADVVAETFGEPDPEPEPEPPAPEPPAKEPEAAAEGQQSLEAETPEQVAARAAKVVLPFGRYKERTIGSVYEGTEQDAPDPGWIGWLSRTKDNGKPADDRARAAARAFVAVHPECLNKGDG